LSNGRARYGQRLRDKAVYRLDCRWTVPGVNDFEAPLRFIARRCTGIPLAF
jgi:hypothetical protein